MWQELKAFLFRGNVLDLAVAVVIGGAFGKIVSSLVQDLIMPIIGLITGNINFGGLFFALSDRPIGSIAEAKELGVSVVQYGLFINSVIDFVIIGTVIFFVVKAANKAIPKPVPAPMKDCPRCFSSIKASATKCPQCTADI